MPTRTPAAPGGARATPSMRGLLEQPQAATASEKATKNIPSRGARAGTVAPRDATQRETEAWKTKGVPMNNTSSPFRPSQTRARLNIIALFLLIIALASASPSAISADTEPMVPLPGGVENSKVSPPYRTGSGTYPTIGRPLPKRRAKRWR